MAEFMMCHSHRAEECERVFPQLQNVAASLKGKTFFCSCPSGNHGGFFQVEAPSAEDALKLLPEGMRATTEVCPGETMTIPS